MEYIPGCVKVWEEEIVLPTYGVGSPDKNPMFLERRVYQGSSGKVYPYAITDKVYEEKTARSYRGLWLENDYLKVLVLPELGGRIHRAYDKTNGYDFVYYNEVIKPALVGLLGPWISGGIEFNWPQHHRPTTFAPLDYMLRENDDGSKTVIVSEVDQMYGTKGMAYFTLFPGKAYIEVRGQLYNRTPLPQTFLWWANPAVSVNENTQSIFPPDVRAVMDHGKRDVSRFPVATGVYYKQDYGAGVDISRYVNIPVPTSYMAYRSDYDFVGGYDYSKEAGILHVADHHISPGKKQWTWGCGDFGQAWDRNLTDENGPYIELMTGVYTDNQPDFTWLKPFEEKSFTQYFMPYKYAADVKNATKEVLLNLVLWGDEADICVYTTEKIENARVVLSSGKTIYLDVTVTLSPNDVLREKVRAHNSSPHDLTLSVFARDGRLMLSYSPPKDGIERMPEPAEAAKRPEEIATCEELYLTGLHVEQYRHATYDPDDYYMEGLRRDPGDARINTAYGMLMLRRCLFTKGESFFRNAIKRLTWKNPNPYDSEAYYALGLALHCQDRFDEAFDAFYKATWTSAQQETSYYYLAAIACRRGHYESSLKFAGRALVKNLHNMKARVLYAALLVKLGRLDEAMEHISETLAIDPFFHAARILLRFVSKGGGSGNKDLSILNGRESSFIEAAIDFAEAGLYEEALYSLMLFEGDSPMVKYYQAYYLGRSGDAAGARAALQNAMRCDRHYCFPNRLEDIAILEYAIQENPSDSRAPYYLGNLWYDKKQYGTARKLWERSALLDNAYPTVWRNLALCYFNKTKEPKKAQAAMERAFSLDTEDARVFMELDQMYKKMSHPPKERIAMFEKYRQVVEQRDDLVAEYVTLLNLTGRSREALDEIKRRKFHPWEGGEGKVARQYVTALLRLAGAALGDGDASEARRLLEEALVFPHNLGEGKLGMKDQDVYYRLGIVQRALGDDEGAVCSLERAVAGDVELAGVMYYNDTPPEMVLYQGLANRALGREEMARARFNKLIDYGERHYFDEVKIDYFAVSLPDLQIFDEDLTKRNKIHCRYLIAMGSYGLGEHDRARKDIEKVLVDDPYHLGAVLLREMLPPVYERA
jgi:tetratricopeptide (TPR) repeat protein